MIFAYRPGEAGLTAMSQPIDLTQAIWIDLYRPLSSQSAAASALGRPVPTQDVVAEPFDSDSEPGLHVCLGQANSLCFGGSMICTKACRNRCAGRWPR